MTNTNGSSAVEFFENAIRDPSRDPIEEANGYRDTMPEDAVDEIGLARGEIAWLREAVRRLTNQQKVDGE